MVEVGLVCVGGGGTRCVETTLLMEAGLEVHRQSRVYHWDVCCIRRFTVYGSTDFLAVHMQTYPFKTYHYALPLPRSFSLLSPPFLFSPHPPPLSSQVCAEAPNVGPRARERRRRSGWGARVVVHAVDAIDQEPPKAAEGVRGATTGTHAHGGGGGRARPKHPGIAGDARARAGRTGRIGRGVDG